MHLQKLDNVVWAKFKKDGFPQYPELCIVFGGTYANGDHATGNAKDLMVSEEDDNGDGNVGGDNGGGNTNDFNEHPIDERVFTSDNVATSVHGKYKLDKTLNPKRRRKSNPSGIVDTCKARQDLLKARASQFVNGFMTSGHHHL
ncbi:uncharacterized protein LOC120289374 [Eucalyptus grandis]|uniref:uncharacterized protein LOC120289374 n=1 Tax=Eucalyptus grandis TaxID=71139 RepID=UPI00192EEC24|nr:uncharacterized protein LOC120289374 [Eucalyptus grandis]